MIKEKVVFYKYIFFKKIDDEFFAEILDIF